MKIGIFGGSFNPPHIAHAMVCFYCLETKSVDRIIVVPCADHPFGKDLAPFEDRLAMTRLAMTRLGKAVEVSDIEGRRSSVSYTIDTVREIALQHEGAELRLIVGSDILDDFSKWKEAEALREVAPLVVVPRMDSEGQGDRDLLIEDGIEDLNNAPFVIPAVSSSQLRARLMDKDSIEGLVSADVLDYIQAHSLYT